MTCTRIFTVNVQQMMCFKKNYNLSNNIIMEKQFLNNKNIELITKNFIKQAKIKNDPTNFNACKTFVTKHMNNISSKYKNKKPNNVPVLDFIGKLNEVTLANCIKENEEKKNKKLKNFNDYKMDRDREFTTPNMSGSQPRPEYSARFKPNPSLQNTMPNNPSNIQNNVQNSDMVMLSDGTGQYFSSTGEIKHGLMSNQQAELQEKNPEVLDKDYYSRKMQYMNYAPNTANKPAEINFGDNGVDTRNFKIDSKYQKNNSEDIQQMANIPQTSFDSPLNSQFNDFNNQFTANPQINTPGFQSNMNNINNLYSGIQNGVPNNQFNKTQSDVGTKINENDFNMLTNKLMKERENIDLPVKTNKFDPMSSPNMPVNNEANNYNQITPTFNPLTSNGGINNLNQQQILKYQKMMAGDISYDTNNKEAFSYNEYKEEKKIPINYGIKKDTSENFVFEISIIKNLSLNQLETLINKINKNNINKIDKFLVNDEKKDEDNHETNDIAVLDEQNNIISKKSNEKNNTTFTINCETFTEPEYYNDYLIEFKNNIKNVKQIEFYNYTFPNKTFIINSSNNIFEFTYQDKIMVIELDEESYTIDELIKTIQTALNDAHINIKFKKNDGYIIISNNNIFSIINNDKSFLKELGFTEDLYEKRNTYTSKYKYNTINVYFKNISDECLFKIDLDKKIPIKISIDKIDIQEIIIQFLNFNNNLYDFYEKPHQFSIKFIE